MREDQPAIKDNVMPKKYTALLAVAAMIAAMPLLSACNTTAGAGQDLNAAGKGIEHSADRNKPY
jgi:predicted small secreted protein